MTTEFKIRPWFLWTGIVVLVLAIGLATWDKYGNKNVSAPTTNPTSQKSATISPSAKTTTSPDATANWKTFNSSLVNLSFKYSPESNYQEKDTNTDAQPSQQLKGKEIYFSDVNKKYPDFETITSDFSIVDSVSHDIISGNLDSKDSFKGISYYDKQYQKIIEKENGIYQVIGYGNMECSPTTGSFLIIKPPLNSGLKYISFYLGSGAEFTKEDSTTQDICEIKSTSIENRINDIQNGKVSEISDNLAKALLIAKTFLSTQ
ncbi:MAG: hypothetical protein US94_C0019G0006 [Berkelbacteria bacterium GW2011_GWB1_38_5]|uniref:Uncharacterized protein n=1 Tax=Berkelbacteria bacterium GW2011_GWB1_38_5 TaxID=1618336 RepID=A0A0G0KEK7_9BACT|nr:MAG: hypothetical protein US94_C0019G0006 [Berkelbacteria bacterium GW2011_GWB1_38_5]